MKYALAGITGLLIGCASTNSINTLPMYGGIPKSEALTKADEEFLKKIDSAGQSRDSSSRYFSNAGWRFFYQGNDNTAMMRFNQAWLLNPKNAQVYFGFGSIIGRRRTSIDSTIYFLKLAHALDENNIPIAASLAYSYSDKAYFLNSKSNSQWKIYKDSSIAEYDKIKSKFSPESDQGIQYFESKIMLGDKDDAQKYAQSIDTTKLAKHQLPRYHFLIFKMNELQ